MLRRTLVSLLAASSLALGVVACDDGTSTPTLSSGIPGNTTVSDLTDAQARQLCNAFQDLANQVAGADVQKRLICVATGVAQQLAGLTTCNTSYSNCMKESTITGVTIDLQCSNVTAAGATGCNATIAQVTACANAEAATVDSLLDQISCKLANDPNALQTIANEAQQSAEMSNVSECQALAAACPDYFGQVSDVLSGMN